MGNQRAPSGFYSNICALASFEKAPIQVGEGIRVWIGPSTKVGALGPDFPLDVQTVTIQAYVVGDPIPVAHGEFDIMSKTPGAESITDHSFIDCCDIYKQGLCDIAEGLVSSSVRGISSVLDIGAIAYISLFEVRGDFAGRKYGVSLMRGWLEFFQSSQKCVLAVVRPFPLQFDFVEPSDDVDLPGGSTCFIQAEESVRKYYSTHFNMIPVRDGRGIMFAGLNNFVLDDGAFGWDLRPRRDPVLHKIAA